MIDLWDGKAIRSQIGWLILNGFVFQVFKKFGVEKFDPTNEPFDPHRHNAMFQVRDNSKPPGTVAHVLKVYIYSLLHCWLMMHLFISFFKTIHRKKEKIYAFYCYFCFCF